MGADQVSELMRHLLREALIVSAPVLLVASLVSFLLSLLQTLTSLQDQTLSTVPRILAVVLMILAGLPWFLRRLVTYTVGLFFDFHRYLG
ncbi:flagellar biosynthetic protein FliQ [Acidipila rosea]|uniref:Flagellar biosynthetic protein FliQ n=1 Tax=Acidipila rosea TaxID=768535 RepID=A0A4R1LAK5_9BACT|nr:flagellar biosynthetic protein FliQ [Acidipila rosea]MBW4027576.1 flagellar biosynthetic protein FliQ [Acidobacteriota bacterium]TCK75478.1 flagellar biosynthetic protein FliQ [Acidipila rosea]